MRELAHKTLETLLLSAVAGAATFAGLRLVQELSNPYSSLRLRAGDAIDRIREVTAR